MRRKAIRDILTHLVSSGAGGRLLRADASLWNDLAPLRDIGADLFADGFGWTAFGDKPLLRQRVLHLRRIENLVDFAVETHGDIRRQLRRRDQGEPKHGLVTA